MSDPVVPLSRVKTMLDWGHLITTLGVILAAFTWKAEIETQTKINDMRIADLHLVARDYREEQRKGLTELRARLIRIEEKLDAKADKK